MGHLLEQLVCYRHLLRYWLPGLLHLPDLLLQRGVLFHQSLVLCGKLRGKKGAN